MQLGWSDRTTTLERYFKEQTEDERVIFMAEWENKFTGYNTMKRISDYLPFAKHGISEIEDLSVLPIFRRHVIATALLAKFTLNL